MFVVGELDDPKRMNHLAKLAFRARVSRANGSPFAQPLAQKHDQLISPSGKSVAARGSATDIVGNAVIPFSLAAFAKRDH